MGTLALLEVLDRDDQPRQTFAVQEWPVLVGRDIDNDLVLSDPHVAGRHFVVAQTDNGLELILGDTLNGVQLGDKRLRSGERGVLSPLGDSIEFTAGRTRLRLRLADRPLAPEQPLAATTPLLRRVAPIALGAAVLSLMLMFNTYLSTDPGNLGRAIGGMLLATVTGAAVWCGAWALLSKTFAHQARFGWHLRVFLFGSIATLLVGSLSALLAFSLSQPWLSNFGFIAVFAVAATTLYFHLLAVEPARRRLLKWVAVTFGLVGVGLNIWFNMQRADQLGDELYMNHLFPPALRLAKPVATEGFVNGLSGLRADLDKKAKEPAQGEDGNDD